MFELSVLFINSGISHGIKKELMVKLKVDVQIVSRKVGRNIN